MSMPTSTLCLRPHSCPCLCRSLSICTCHVHDYVHEMLMKWNVNEHFIAQVHVHGHGHWHMNPWILTRPWTGQRHRQWHEYENKHVKNIFKICQHVNVHVCRWIYVHVHVHKHKHEYEQEQSLLYMYMCTNMTMNTTMKINKNTMFKNWFPELRCWNAGERFSLASLLLP